MLQNFKINSHLEFLFTFIYFVIAILDRIIEVVSVRIRTREAFLMG